MISRRSTPTTQGGPQAGELAWTQRSEKAATTTAATAATARGAATPGLAESLRASASASALRVGGPVRRRARCHRRSLRGGLLRGRRRRLGPVGERGAKRPLRLIDAPLAAVADWAACWVADERQTGCTVSREPAHAAPTKPLSCPAPGAGTGPGPDAREAAGAGALSGRAVTTRNGAEAAVRGGTAGAAGATRAVHRLLPRPPPRTRARAQHTRQREGCAEPLLRQCRRGTRRWAGLAPARASRRRRAGARRITCE